jgi:hypothetical protein
MLSIFRNWLSGPVLFLRTGDFLIVTQRFLTFYATRINPAEGDFQRKVPVVFSPALLAKLGL